MPSRKYKIFVSSVQGELAEERRAVKSFITNDRLLSRFVSEVFLFEEIPAADRRPAHSTPSSRRLTAPWRATITWSMLKPSPGRSWNTRAPARISWSISWPAAILP